ncbi:MAG TPA: competence/damage-inducible protein A [Crocinitomix sp.]|nr:competence/damage-inducible protein A [Crocinitomix sp.]
MNSHIITIGDEILVGQTVDTNSTFIAQQLNRIGITVTKIQSIKDERKAILETLDDTLDNNDIIILTGGLGPTNDDITKKVLTEYFNDELLLRPDILEHNQLFFKRFNKPFLEVNKQQAMLPKGAKIIKNDLGTASGMWWTLPKGKHIISLPGVPYEMKGLFKKILPDLKPLSSSKDGIFHHTLLFQGIGETKLAELLKETENEMKTKGITVSYLPSVAQVKLRLTGTILQKKDILTELEKIKQNLIKYCYGEGDELLEEILGKLLIKNKSTIGTVESCTGGALASKFVSTPGSSAYFQGGLLTYSNYLKQNIADVPNQLIKKYGAVSKEVVESMAENGRKKLEVDYCISTSGIAGPTGGTAEKPVGLVWIGIATSSKTYAKAFNFGHNRKRNIESTVYYALNYLRRILINVE